MLVLLRSFVCSVLGLASSLVPSLSHDGAAAALAHPQDGPDADVRITIGREDVRISITVNLLFADALVGVLRENRDRLEPVEHEVVHRALFAYFEREHRVVINDKVVAPQDRGFDVEDADLALLPLFPRFGTRAMTKLRLLLVHPALQPNKVALTWGAFPPDLAVATDEGVPPVIVKGVVLANGREDEVTFTVTDPVFEWRRDGGSEEALFASVPTPPPAPRVAVPIVSLGLLALYLVLAMLAFVVADAGRALSLLKRSALPFVALLALCWPLASVDVPLPFVKAPVPEEAEAQAVFAALHGNVYRAFDYGTEDEVYDALARSVHGRLLEQLYTSIYEGLVLRDEGGALSRVKKLERQRTVVSPASTEDGSAAFDVDAKWTVYGEVMHWGHGHNQTNEYEASYRIANKDDAWRIVAYTPKAARTLEKSDLQLPDSIETKGK